jgi:hypothetical protein
MSAFQPKIISDGHYQVEANLLKEQEAKRINVKGSLICEAMPNRVTKTVIDCSEDSRKTRCILEEVELPESVEETFAFKVSVTHKGLDHVVHVFNGTSQTEKIKVYFSLVDDC